MRRADAAGFTLIEMLVVLAIVGVASGAAVLALGHLGGQGSAETEARLLAGRLKLAADEALVTDRGIALAWNAQGYGFVRADPPGGVPDPLPELGTRRVLPAGLQLTLDSAAPLVPIVADGTGHPVEATLADRRGRWTVRFDGFDAAIRSAGALR